MKGVCCSCQNTVDIRRSMIPRLQMQAEGWDDCELELYFNEAIAFVCCPHNAFGQYCEGSGDCPQVVIEPCSTPA